MPKLNLNSTLAAELPIDWSSQRMQGIFNLAYSALGLLKIGVIIIALGALFATFKLLKSQISPLPRITHSTRSREGRGNVVENVEVIEMERNERVSTPYY